MFRAVVGGSSITYSKIQKEKGEHMSGTARIIPNYNNARLYSIRGRVESHGVQESGWWIFKKRIPVIHVRVREDQLTAFNDIARNQMGTLDGHLTGIAPVLKLGMTEEERREYPVGAEIGISFGYSGPINQFFTGAVPLKVIKLQVMDADTRLENEVVMALS